MKSRILSITEQFIVNWRKLFFMSDFVKDSLTEIEFLIDKAIDPLTRQTCIGIFGTRDSAATIHRRLIKKKFTNIAFISTDPLYTIHRGCPVVDSNGSALNAFDAIFVSSLSHGSNQVEVLRENGFKNTILSFPHLPYLSTGLSSDSSTTRAIRNLAGSQKSIPAFIIGNGPSLKKTDPRRISDQCLKFAGNGIVRLKDFCPDFFFALETTAVRLWSEEISNLPAQRFYPANLKTFIKAVPGLAQKSDVYFPLCYEQKGLLDIFRWSSDGFESGHSIVCPMIQFALLMGCDPIFIIGVDISYGSGQNYFLESYHSDNNFSYKKREAEKINRYIRHGLERSIEACKRSSVRVFNCSPYRNLPFLENLDFRHALNYNNNDNIL